MKTQDDFSVRCRLKRLRIFALAVSLMALGGCVSQTARKTVSMCDVMANPTNFQMAEVTVSGWMSLEFEDWAVGCRSAPKEVKTEQFIWISFDIESIEKNSPQFLNDVRLDMEVGTHYEHAVKRNIVARGRLEFCESFLKDPAAEPCFMGFGHLFGSTVGEFRVLEIVEYGANQGW